MVDRSGPHVRTDYLLVLRGLAACAVMLGHLPLQSADVPLLSRWIDWTFLVRPYGRVPVLMFFALSGYLITKGFCTSRYTADREGTSQYLRNRALRIFPLYWVSILVCAGIYWERTVADPGAVLGLFVFTETYLNRDPIVFNTPYWSIPIEVFFYALAPLLFLIGRALVARVGWLFTGLAVLAVWRLYAAWYFPPLPGPDGEPLYAASEWRFVAHRTFFYNLDAFLLGGLANFVVASRFGERVREARWLRTWLKVGFLTGVLGLLWYGVAVSRPAVHAGAMDWFTVYALTPATALVVAVLALLQDTSLQRGRRGILPGLRGSALRGLEWLGLFSYGIYLWNVPARVVWVKAGLTPAVAGRVGFTAACIVLTFLAAICSFYAIERPALRRRSRPLELERAVRGATEADR